MTPPRRAIITFTSAHAPLHHGEQTGLFISEALHPFNVFKKAGFEVDLVSTKGTYTADWLSLQPAFLNDEERKQYEDLEGEFRKGLDAGLTAESVQGKEYGIFFASAGHAALIDYPHAEGLQKIGSKVWNDGGIVSAVCHGPAILPGIIDQETGKSVITGKTITGFTTQAEYDMEVMDPIRSWGEPLIDEWAEKVGAKYSRPAGVWDDFHISENRLVTGTNPQSAKSTAAAAVVAFDAFVKA